MTDEVSNTADAFIETMIKEGRGPSYFIWVAEAIAQFAIANAEADHKRRMAMAQVFGKNMKRAAQKASSILREEHLQGEHGKHISAETECGARERRAAKVGKEERDEGSAYDRDLEEGLDEAQAEAVALIEHLTSDGRLPIHALWVAQFIAQYVLVNLYTDDEERMAMAKQLATVVIKSARHASLINPRLFHTAKWQCSGW